jgi:hypothetical protein
MKGFIYGIFGTLWIEFSIEVLKNF